jgi:hypothetical protein
MMSLDLLSHVRLEILYVILIMATMKLMAEVMIHTYYAMFITMVSIHILGILINRLRG